MYSLLLLPPSSTSFIGDPGFLSLLFFGARFRCKNNYDVGCRPHTTRHFCFGKSAKTIIRPCAALRVPPPPPRIRWLGNSLRSDSPRQRVDSALRLRRAQRENPRPRQKLKAQCDSPTMLSFQPLGEISHFAGRQISHKGRYDKGRVRPDPFMVKERGPFQCGPSILFPIPSIFFKIHFVQTSKIANSRTRIKTPRIMEMYLVEGTGIGPRVFPS